MEEHNQNHTANLLHNSHDNNNDVRSMLCSHRHLQYIGPCKDVAYVYEPEDEYHCVHQVLDFLFQGSAKASEDNEILAYHKINAIVNVTNDMECKFENGNSHQKTCIEYFTCDVDDDESEEEKMFNCFEGSSNFIETKRKEKKKVLVHCRAGISRSSTITLAYLVKYQNMSLKEAFTFLRSKRSIIKPNIGFWKALIRWENEVRCKDGNFLPSVILIHCPFGFIPKFVD